MKSIKELKSKIIKRKRLFPEPLFDRLVARRISIYLTWILIHTPVTANQVTASQLVVGAVGCVLLGTGDKLLGGIGVFCFHFAYILDCVDGEISRYRGTSSMTGAFFDDVCHTIFNSMMYAGIAFALHNASKSIIPTIFGYLAVMFCPPYGILHLHDSLVRKRKAELSGAISASKLTPKTQNNNTNAVKSSGTHPQPSGFYGLYKKVATKTGFFFTVAPYNVNIITLFFVLDVIFPNLLPKPLSVLYFLILFYGTLLPLRHIGGIAKSVMEKRIESDYDMLFRD